MVVQSVQLSHEELLLTLGVLRLPLPLAMGEQPTAGYDDTTLNAALTSAMTSLLARDLLISDDPPMPAPELRDLVTVTALAGSCLMVAASHKKSTTVTHFSRQGDRLVAHTSPRDRVHRLTALERPDAITEQLLAMVVPHTPAGPSLSFAIATNAFGLALDALDAGQPQTAQRILIGSGLPTQITEVFISRAGQSMTRYVFVAFTDLQQPQPNTETVLVVQGSTETWYVTEGTAPDTLHVETSDSAALGQKLGALVQLLG